MKQLVRAMSWPYVRLVLITLLVLSALMFRALPAAAQTDVTGVWVVALPTGDGNIIKTFLDLSNPASRLPAPCGTTMENGPSVKEVFATANCTLSSSCGKRTRCRWLLAMVRSKATSSN